MDVATCPMANPYVLRDGCYDEMCSASGQPRPEWQQLVRELDRMGPAEMQGRWQQAQRHMRDLGVTFNPLDETGAESRPWEFNPIPFLIGRDDWLQLERGLQQRARLIQMVLDDLLRDQRLIRDGVVPPDLLFAHPRFQPASLGLPPSAYRQMLTYAADLSRNRQGQWCVTGDRTSSPNGLGYVLENRVVSSRMLPQVIRDHNIIRLARFFANMLDTIAASAPQGKLNPRIILLTEGVESPNYFEDSYLSRYLNCTLAEGADLTVRDNGVKLKTLGGLVPVDVILRRIRDEMCDPVELIGASKLGVAGLLDAVRANSVTVFNPIGSRYVESPAWMPYWAGICRHLLAEDLLLPSLATWWCGEPTALSYVLEHFDSLTIRPAFKASGAKAVLASQLTAHRKSDLISRIRKSPYLYVGQAAIESSTVPVWCESQLEPWHVALRCFVLSGQDGYAVLPGGLSRAARDRHHLENRIRAGNRSQDVWVLGDAPSETFSLLPSAEAKISLSRGGSELPSRVADNFYWYGRNLERTDGLARITRAMLNRVASDEEFDPASFRFLLSMLVEREQVPAATRDLEQAKAIKQMVVELPRWVFDENNPLSIRASIQRLVNGAVVLRDRISLDAWRILSDLDEASRVFASHRHIEIADALVILQRVLRDFAALTGLASERMTRTMGWRFFDLGKRLEGAVQVTQMLRAFVGGPQGDDLRILGTLLETADGVMTYRARYRAELQVVPIVDLLVSDESNPRAIAFQLTSILEHVRIINQGNPSVTRSEDERLTLSLLSAVQLADPFEICDVTMKDGKRTRPALDKVLLRLWNQLPQLSDAISGRFLIHAGMPRHFGSLDKVAR